jgi:hypothetical protein
VPVSRRRIKKRPGHRNVQPHDGLLVQHHGDAAERHFRAFLQAYKQEVERGRMGPDMMKASQTAARIVDHYHDFLYWANNYMDDHDSAKVEDED